MSMVNNESTKLNVRAVNKLLIIARNQALMANDIFEPGLLQHDLHFKGLTIAHISRCILRVNVIV